MDNKLLKLRSVLKTMPLNDSQINNILGIIDAQNKEIDDTISPLLEEYYSYGIEKDYTNISPNCIRIGNLDLHRSLPIQSKMRGCLLDDDGNVVEYLPENDWTTATRDGSKGQVMVEIPMHYRKFETKGTKNIVRLSEYPLPGYHQVPQMYVSAYEASIERSTGKLCSVVNDGVDYRGGDNNANYDGTYHSLLGRPVTSINRTKFRSAARKRNTANTSWNCYLYQVHKALFWLFTVEYAQLNSQAAYNSELTSEGFRQGGLGEGVSNWSDSEWLTFNNHNPFVPCGLTDILGNSTGVVAYTVYNEDGSELKTSNVPRYRGVENPFGHIWKWIDGCHCVIQSEASGGLSEFYVCDEPANFTNSGVTNYQLRGVLPRNRGYIKSLILGEYGEVMPLEVDANSTTSFRDYFYTRIPENGVYEHGVFLGGTAYNSTNAGFLCMNTSNVVSNTYEYLGSRLCFFSNKIKIK